MRLAALLLVIPVLVVANPAPQAKPDPAKPTFAKAVVPFVKKYCVGCHSGPSAPDKVDLSTLKTEADYKSAAKMIKKCAREVTKKSMPPKGSYAPSDAERAAFDAWVKANIK